MNLANSKNYVPSKNLLRKAGKALGDFKMIDHGDKIMVGLSGGKDSLMLLLALVHLRRKIKADFTLGACTVDISGGEMDLSELNRFCTELGVGYFINSHPTLEIIRARNERSPCSLCANMRRGILCSEAKKHGFNVLALGHNLDDVAETVLLNLFRTGRFKCFKPVSWLSRMEISVIRPLIYIEESHISSEAARLNLPLKDMKCPYNNVTERATTKELLKHISGSIPDVKLNIEKALSRLDPEDLWSDPL
jgi:tRNA(Ile)-lysidine synthase TilS/MesJ